MTITATRTRNYLKETNLTPLFVEELGWDYYDTTVQVTVEGQTHKLLPVAHKRGFVVLRYATEKLPEYSLRRKIERAVAKIHREHLIIYIDGDGKQVWQWVRREPGRPIATREQAYDPTYKSGEALAQKLNEIAFTLDEEEDLTLIDVAGRVRTGFNVERATRDFFRSFKRERDAFEKFLVGIPDDDLARWYVSVMLNRLMFIYFMQKKGFLDNNTHYLRDRLQAMQQRGEDRYYRDFLCPLFFAGFALPENRRPPEMRKLLGKIPYLNGGIFQQHHVERLHGKTITIADRAFEKLFDFFDQYQWHLDDRPLRDDREINPDVLGYIFEKYINQKQMGAYYTKEDITGYISQNTILPFLFDEVQRRDADVFRGPEQMVKLLQADPDRYIYDAVRKGCDLPLPEAIAAGIDDVSARGAWNEPTPEEYALPTEIWRETVARRRRYEDVWLRMVEGEIEDINDFITYNLDIQQFALDAIENCERPETLRAFWKAINGVTVLDPTCGSGAFLFAALNILEPLYQACLARMRVFVDELPDDAHAMKYSDFKDVLAHMERHPNDDYFVLKSIIVNNLYGVDIMPEAIEIAKLRLFLKLVAQVDTVKNIEPLPDIDFNIRAGNTLVGFTTAQEVEKAMKVAAGGQGKLVFEEDQATLARIEEKAGDVDRLFARFREMQTKSELKDYDAADFAETKEALQERLRELEGELNGYLALQYGVDPEKPKEYEKWLRSHQPFHWFIEFYGILRDGGFDVVIGNPPYIEYYRVRKEYRLPLSHYDTEVCGNLYAICLERSYQLLSDSGRLGMIVQQPIVSTQRMKAIRSYMLKNSKILWTSTYDDRPSKLFQGINHARVAIVMCQASSLHREDDCVLYVTSYKKWYQNQRDTLFASLFYRENSQHLSLDVFPKLGSAVEENIVTKLLSQSNLFERWTSANRTKYSIYYKITGVGHWFTITLRPPRFFRDDIESSSTRESEIFFRNREDRDRSFVFLNSSLFYWYYQLRTNCRDFNPSDYRTFPVPKSAEMDDWSKLALAYQSALDKSSTFRTQNHKKTGSLRIEVFRPRETKSVVDEIDSLLASAYELTDEELDFIINYDIKYRMGDELFEDEGEEDD